jgi:hypothetical protein
MMTSALGAAAAVVFVPVGYLNFGVAGASAGLCFAEVAVLISSWYMARRSWAARSLDRLDARINRLQEVVR